MKKAVAELCCRIEGGRVGHQLNNAIQCVAEAGSETMDRNNDAKCEAQAARADLGMFDERDNAR